MQQNTDRMCTKTLESLITLINDKRTTRKTYADERQRLEVEFAKVLVLIAERPLVYVMNVSQLSFYIHWVSLATISVTTSIWP